VTFNVTQFHAAPPLPAGRLTGVHCQAKRVQMKDGTRRALQKWAMVGLLLTNILWVLRGERSFNRERALQVRLTAACSAYARLTQPAAPLPPGVCAP
jgi:hypothetical protein